MTTSEPGGARAADPERLVEAERRIRAASEWTDHHHRRYAELIPADLRVLLAEYDRRGSEIGRLTVWATDRDERIACLEDERDEARDEVARLSAERNATADSLMEVAGQRIAALAACRDLEREAAEGSRPGRSDASWLAASAKYAAVLRIRKALGEETDG